MAVPSIAFYAASPPSSICSNAHSCQPNSHSPSDYECKPNTRNPSNSSQRSAIGGLSCLFSSHSVKHTSSMSFAGDDELSSSFSYSSYSPLSASVKCGDPSPTSVFHGSISCGSSSRSPSLRNARSFNGDSSPSSSLKMNRGLFSGCVRNALGSCIDFDSPICDSSTGLDDEFTFNLEENMREMSFEPYASKMLKRSQAKHQIFYDEFVIKAFHEAEKAHRGQLRASGDPYLQHCVETGVLLAIIGANSVVVASGLLHDTLDDSIMNYDYLFHTFGAGVADLVEGVSKLSQLSKLARDNNTAYKTEEADRLHTMFLAMADARAVLIKLADRLHNMMTLEALSIEKQQRFAKETLEIFVPLANRLGISTWKEQLENLCFKHLHPKEYSDLSSRLVESYDETPIKTAIEKLKSALKDEGLSYHLLSGRHKSLYSIYSKMLKKGLVMDQIHDIYGLRLIVDNTKDCYTALSIIRRLWPEIVGKFKDYIIHPKFNGYQSLHTVVMGEGILPLEVQIRTKDMHLQAEFGFAAHWRYKEGDCKYSSFVLQMVEWARWIVTWQCKTMDRGKIWTPCPLPAHLQDCPHSCVPSLEQDGPIFIVMVDNEKMSIKELPANTTVIDLLEAIKNETPRWSPYGFAVTENLSPRLNQEPVKDLSCRLKMGDMVELTPVTSNKSLTEYREEIQRMYNYDMMAASSPGWKRSYF